MIKSMTGYGRGVSESNGKEYVVEIKSVNHRYNDISIKMPRYLSFLEDKVRHYVSKSILRGKTEIYITVNSVLASAKNIVVDKELAGIYISEMRQLIEKYDLKDDISLATIMRLPDIVTTANVENEEQYWDELKISIDLALKQISDSKLAEGEKLKLDIEDRLQKVSEYVDIVKEKSSNLLEDYKVKLTNRINELGANGIIDENRLGMEVVLFADKSSICEEVTRLKSHIDALEKMLEASEPIGKKIDFLVQEMNRETNTIGSKANNIGITNYVVEMKNEIENIREQVQNIE